MTPVSPTHVFDQTKPDANGLHFTENAIKTSLLSMTKRPPKLSVSTMSSRMDYTADVLGIGWQLSCS